MVPPSDITAAYAEAVFPASHTVLGRPLATFTLGHLILLQRFHSPFISDRASHAENKILPTAGVGRGDTALAAFLLTRDPIAAWSQLGSLRMRLFMGLFARGLDRLDQARAELHAYLAASCDWPRFWMDEKSHAKANQSPAVQTIRVQLMKHFGLGYRDTLAVPWRLAVWDCIAHAELEGSITLDTPERAAAIGS